MESVLVGHKSSLLEIDVACHPDTSVHDENEVPGVIDSRVRASPHDLRPNDLPR
ncbi:MAG: hypothetical protein GY896_09025 [Gammaproteobacteria bacterium]|nr:hypothetical protein [Gammaproteobacteria bacterium]